MGVYGLGIAIQEEELSRGHLTKPRVPMWDNPQVLEAGEEALSFIRRTLNENGAVSIQGSLTRPAFVICWCNSWIDELMTRAK